MTTTKASEDPAGIRNMIRANPYNAGTLDMCLVDVTPVGLRSVGWSG